jgi:hypothetical protein
MVLQEKPAPPPTRIWRREAGSYFGSFELIEMGALIGGSGKS